MDMLDWVLQQSLPVTILSVIIYKMWGYILTKDKTIKAKDEALAKLSELALKVAALWDVKSNLNTEEHKQIKAKVQELLDFTKTCNTSKNDNCRK